MKSVFFDTSAQIALFSEKDHDHQKARVIIDQLDRENAQFFMTDYIFDEVLTTLTKRVHRRRAIEYSQHFPAGKVMLVFVEGPDFYQAKRIFEHYHDKDWSFTDCVSFAVMRRLGINTAFSFDRNFTQAGFNLLK